MSTRNEIRKKILSKRQHLDAKSQTDFSNTICDKLLNLQEFNHAQKIALYIPNKGEVDPRLIITATRKAPEYYLPILDPDKPDHLLFQKYNSNDQLTPNSYGIPEPKLDPKKLIDPKNLDCVLVPLVAFDSGGNRLGMGVGYYDRSFAFIKDKKRPHKPLLIGLAYEFQKVNNCNPAIWDVPLDMIVTNSEIFLPITN